MDRTEDRHLPYGRYRVLFIDRESRMIVLHMREQGSAETSRPVNITPDC